MQKYRLFILCIFFSLFLSTTTYADTPSIKSIRLLANQTYRSAQDMVVHGSEGHLHEIVLYGGKLLEHAEALLKAVELADETLLDNQKSEITASIRETIEKGTEAVELGKKDTRGAALAAAKKASFHAKRTRQRIQSLR